MLYFRRFFQNICYIWAVKTITNINMTLWILWLVLAAALLIVEVLSQMVWTLCIAVGCLGALVGDLCGASLELQLIILAIVAVAAFIVVVPYVKRWHERNVIKEGGASLTGMDALIGRKAVVTEDVRPGEKGRARIDGDVWQVVAPGVDTVIPRGAEVSVKAYDSIILTVVPA
jgi:membrane protein implicated in regulation of membrane protease activity